LRPQALLAGGKANALPALVPFAVMPRIGLALASRTLKGTEAAYPQLRAFLYDRVHFLAFEDALTNPDGLALASALGDNTDNSRLHPPAAGNDKRPVYRALPVKELYFTAGREPENLGNMSRLIFRQEEGVFFSAKRIKKKSSHGISYSLDFRVKELVKPPSLGL
jgi:hypothetical protein